MTMADLSFRHKLLGNRVEYLGEVSKKTTMIAEDLCLQADEIESHGFDSAVLVKHLGPFGAWYALYGICELDSGETLVWTPRKVPQNRGNFWTLWWAISKVVADLFYGFDSLMSDFGDDYNFNFRLDYYCVEKSEIASKLFDCLCTTYIRYFFKVKDLWRYHEKRMTEKLQTELDSASYAVVYGDHENIVVDSGRIVGGDSIKRNEQKEEQRKVMID